MVHNPGWQVYWCWEQGNNACFCAIHFSGGCAWGYVICTFVANQHHHCRTIRVSEWLHIRKTELVILCRYMHGPRLPWQLSGFTTQVKEVASECKSTHCVIHREMLASLKMWPELNNVLQDVIKITNHIKVHALNSVCSCSSVRRWTQSTHVFSYTQKWEGFLKVDHWPEFLSSKSCSRDFF